MALTKISTGGVKDDAASQAKIADEAIDEARLQVSNAGTNGQFLQKQSGNTGGLTWATVTVPDSDKIEEGNTSIETVDTGSDGHVKIITEGNERTRFTSDGKILVGDITTPFSTTGYRKVQIGQVDGGWINLARTGVPADGNHLGAIQGFSKGADGTYHPVAGFDLKADGTPSNTSKPSRIEIYTTPASSTTQTERFRVGSAGQLGVAGANYGTSGQVLTSGGASAAPSWTTVAGGLSSDAQNNTVGGTNAGDSFTGTDANNNTLLGYNAGTAITSGDSNTAIGYNSLQAVETASSNVAIGNHAGYSVSSGGKCVYLGDYSGYNSTTGHGNIGIGESSMGHSAAVTGHYNIGIGMQAFKGDGGAAISNHYNIALGANALQRQTSATENIAIGMEAGRGPSSGGLYGGYNIFIGSYAGHKVESGQVNCLVGRSAGAFLTHGDHNLLLGYAAGNTNSPSGQITTADDIVCLGDNNITNLYCADTSISSSDKRDKTDVTDFTHGLKWINQLKPVTYRWDKRTWYDEYNEDGSLKTAGTPDGTKKRARQHIGFLAQDVLAVEQADGFASKKDDMLVVNLNEDDTAYGLKYERLVPVLVNAIKELSTEVNTLKTKVAALEAA